MDFYPLNSLIGSYSLIKTLNCKFNNEKVLRLNQILDIYNFEGY